MTRPSVYIETSIFSYLTARPSRNEMILAHQQLTREWWQKRRRDYTLFVSPYVVLECQMGDVEFAIRRLQMIGNIPILAPTENAMQLAEALLKRGPLPPQAKFDAIHIAIAAAQGLEYLLTWNCKHIANPRMRDRIEALCRKAGFEPPILCTPEALPNV